MKKNYELKGSCTCGNVKYKVEGKPLFTQACHCKNCKIRVFWEKRRILLFLQCLNSINSSWIPTKLGLMTDEGCPMSDFESWLNRLTIQQDNAWRNLMNLKIRHSTYFQKTYNTRIIRRAVYTRIIPVYYRGVSRI